MLGFERKNGTVAGSRFVSCARCEVGVHTKMVEILKMVAEVGCNHKGDMDIAKGLISAAGKVS